MEGARESQERTRSKTSKNVAGISIPPEPDPTSESGVEQPRSTLSTEKQVFLLDKAFGN